MARPDVSADPQALGDGVLRCFGDDDACYRDYHDREWGRPVLGEHELLERVCLEGFQSGLSWLTILRKRAGFRAAFAGFEPEVVARMGPGDVTRLMADPSIVRNRAKIEATLTNARAALALRDAGTSLPELVWSLRPPPRRAPGSPAEVPALTPASTSLARELRRRGFRFVGPTTAYALMQAAGLVNDHLAGCLVRAEVDALQAAVPRVGPGS